MMRAIGARYTFMMMIITMVAIIIMARARLQHLVCVILLRARYIPHRWFYSCTSLDRRALPA